MKRTFLGILLGAVLTLMSQTVALATPVDSGPDSDESTTALLVQRANMRPVERDLKAAIKGGHDGTAAYGSRPTRKGVILATPDKFKGLIPTGHAAIVWDRDQVIESLDAGVITGRNNWNITKTQAYGVTVRGTSVSQDARAADWAYSQRWKPYNINYLDIQTRSRFYCS